MLGREELETYTFFLCVQSHSSWATERMAFLVWFKFLVQVDLLLITLYQLLKTMLYFHLLHIQTINLLHHFPLRSLILTSPGPVAQFQLSLFSPNFKSVPSLLLCFLSLNWLLFLGTSAQLYTWNFFFVALLG